MGGIGSTLQIAKTALSASAYGLNVTGNNIANVSNEDYSRQSIQLENAAPKSYSGVVVGNGVSIETVLQSVNQLLEDRLTDEQSTLSASEEAESYMAILESFFDEESESSLTALMSDFWNSWQDLADNPDGSSERVAVLENAEKLADRFNLADTYFDSLHTNITNEIGAAVNQINDLTEQIATINQEIVRSETLTRANDLRDQRNGMIDELGDLIDIETYEQPNGTMIVSVTKGLDIVHGVNNTELYLESDDIYWAGSDGSNINISDKIAGGKIGGWLTIRDEIIPEFSSEIDELASEMIWALNYQHSQGSGLEYFTEAVTGEYAGDSSGLLSSLKYGNKIDYTGDFTVWLQDSSGTESEYTSVTIDMGISEATLSDWQGTASGADEAVYQLTVVDSAVIGDFYVSETDGSGLAATVGSTTDVSAALDLAIADQKLTVSGSPSGTQIIDINDTNGEASRSAASIAEVLSEIDGITAYASETSATFDLSNLTNLPNDVQDGDEVSFSLYVDGGLHTVSFVVESDSGSLEDQFEDSLMSVVKEINTLNSDDDLYVEAGPLTDQVTLTSTGGHTLGIQDFEVVDNASVRLTGFTNFTEGDSLIFTVESNGTPSSTTEIEVDLSGVGDPPDQALVAAAFYDALSSSLGDAPFTVENDPATNSVILRTTDGSDITLKDAGGAADPLAGFTVNPFAGTASNAGNVDDDLVFDGSGDTATFDADTQDTDSLDFISTGTFITVNESSAAAGSKAAAVTGTITLVMEPGMAVHSNASGAGSLFEDNYAKVGSSIVTLGGDGGYSGFTDMVTFEVDGIAVSYDVAAAGHTTELEFAQGLEAALTAALVTVPVDESDYQIIRTGTSVSILKNQDLDNAIEITNFSESVSNDATLAVSTGTGQGTSEPVNERLESGNSLRDSATSTLYDDEGIIKWEKFDKDGFSTGEYGYVTVSDEGRVTIVEDGAETLSFELSSGSLVAGNTLTVNMDASGSPDPLEMTVKGSANNILETYQFTVVSGGKVGELVDEENEEPITIQWTSGDSYGTFTLEGDDPPITPEAPIEVTVDGMILKFYDGTLVDGDVFTITTDASGLPISDNSEGVATAETASDWHWTLDSFADQFNRQTPGMTATTTTDNRLTLSRSEAYYAIENVEYSGSEGFSEVNASISVTDWSAIEISATDLRFVRSNGAWGIQNDPTGGKISLIPEGGDDDGFGVDVNGDGVADMEIRFEDQVTGDGFVEFDLVKTDTEDLSFAFSNGGSTDSGLLAALGINTFYNGQDAATMEVNSVLNDIKNIAAATIDAQTGVISLGDNSNAIAMSGVQYEEYAMKQWEYKRGEDANSSLITTTLDEYLQSMIGSMGIESRSIKNATSFSEALVAQLTEQRDAVSAVSLDEEMIKLIEFQHAYTAASKLISVADEMLNTLVSMR